MENFMQQRINLMEKGGAAVSALLGLNGHLAKSGLEENLLQLINFRVSQINGCAYCLDMHSKDLRAGGETEQRIYLLAAWRESPFYTKRERAALSWAEAITLVGERHVSDDVYDEVRKEFSEAELIDLTLAVIMINSWNRMNIAFHTEAGNYQPGQFAAHNG
jgi:AhpD family alkylhydroperoxidase